MRDPSGRRQHPRGYVEVLEQHNSSLEDHIAHLEQSLRDARRGNISEQRSPSNLAGNPTVTESRGVSNVCEARSENGRQDGSQQDSTPHAPHDT